MRVARLPVWAVALGLAVAYLATARLGLSLALPPDYKATAVWLPSGLALAAAFLTRLRVWPGVWAGAFAANLWDAFDPNRLGSFGAHLISSAAIATGSTLQAVAAAALVRRFVGPEGVLGRARDAFRFVTIIPAACLIAATVGVSALVATGLVPWAAAPNVWWTWWVGDTVGALVVAPVVLCAARCERLRRPPAEAVALFVLLAGCCAFVFGGLGPAPVRTAPLAYLSLPFLVWAAIRFGPRGATLAVILIAAFAVWGTVHGTGPFVHNDVYQSLLLLDVFLAVVVVTSLVLGAVLREREGAEAALRASEAKFRQLAEALPQLVWTCRADGACDYLSPQWVAYTGAPEAEQLGSGWLDRVHPDDRAPTFAAWADAVARDGLFDVEFRIRRADGAYRWFKTRAVPLRDEAGRTAKWYGTNTDIDDLERAQAELAQQKAELQLILDTVPALIFFKDRNHRLVRVNNELVRVVGLPLDAIVGRTDSELGSPHADGYRVHEEEIMRTGATRTVVEPLHTFAGTRWLQTTKLPHRDEAGRVLGVLGFSVDITEQKRAEEEVRRLNAELERRVAERTAELRASEELLDSFFEAPGSLRGVVELADGDIVHLRDNAEAAAFFGRSPDEMRNRRAGALGVSAEAIRLWSGHYRESRRLGRPVQFEFAVPGGGRWIQATVSPLARATAERYAYVAVDVTARRTVEDALRESEQRFRGAFDHAPIGLALVSPEGRWLKVNQSLCQILGYTETELLATDFQALTHPDDLGSDLALVGQVLRGERATYQLEKRYVHKDGRPIFVLLAVSLVRGARGESLYFVAQVKDITERKRTEGELRESRQQLALALEAAQAGVWSLDLSTRTFAASEQARALHGVAPGEPLDHDGAFLRVHPDDRPRVGAALQRTLDAGDRYQVEYRVAGTADRWLSAVAEVQPGPAGPRLLGLVQDVSERKRSEEALRASEERYRETVEAAPDAIVSTDTRGTILGWNRGAERVFGWTAAEAVGRDVELIVPPEHLGACRAAMAAFDPDRHRARGRALEVPGRRKGGGELPVEIALAHWGAGAGRRFTAIIRDSTERKRAEHALRVSEERFRVLFEYSSDAHLIFDEADGILDCNAAAVRMLRYADKGAVLALHPAVLSPEFQPDGRRSLEKCVEMDATARRNGYHRFDWLHRRADGEVFPCEVTLTPVALGGRTVLLTVWHDLTERHRAEAALRASEERYRTVVEALAEGVVVQDRDGGIVTCNDRAPEILGLTRDQLAGRTSLDPGWGAVREDGSPFAGDEHPAMVTLRTGVPQSNVLMGVHTPGGELRWVSINAAPVPGADPAGAAVVCSFHDVTAVREANDRLRASVREKEAMLKEIHHRVKNNLQIISTLLDLQCDGLTDPAVLAAFRESRGRVRSMSLIHERLYRSENLASVEFGVYLRGLAADLFRAYRADDEAVRLEVAVSAPPLPLDVAIPCGLLVNELLSNCLKYAFAGRERGIIAVSLCRAGDGPFVLTVADDGVGLPPGFDLRRPTSFGLQLASTLAEQLGGELAVGDGPGARFVVRFPGRR